MAMFILRSACHHPPQGCPRSDRNSTWLLGPGEGEDSGDGLAQRVALRMLGYKDPKDSGRRIRNTDTSPTAPCTGQAGWLPSAGFPSSHSRSQHNPVYAPSTSSKNNYNCYSWFNTPCGDLGSPEYSEAICLLHAEEFQSEERKGNFI